MGSKGNQQTVTTTAPNPAAGAAYSNILNQAQSVAATPWQNYSGEFVAGVNPEQYTGINNVNQYALSALPTLGIAQNMAYSAAQPITQGQIQNYVNPWTQDVINATAAQFNNQNVQQLQNVRGNAIAQGALGGDREGVAEAELANQQNLAQAPVIAGLESQGYTQGVNTALTEQQALASGAYSYGNLGTAAQNAALTGSGAQMQAGGLEQQTQQQQDTALYNQWLASRAYPFQTTQWQAGIDTGVGSQMGGTSTTQGPQPSMWSQAAGLGLGGLGIMGQTGAFGSGGWFPGFASSVGSGLSSLGSSAAAMLPFAMVKRGGRVNGVAHYDDGGGVSPLPYAAPGHAWEPYAGGRGWVPVANYTHGQGAPRPPQPFQQQQDPMRLGEQVAGLAKYFKTGQGVAPPMQISPNPVPTSRVGDFAGAQSNGAPYYPAWTPNYNDPSGSAIYQHGGVVRGYADGGMPQLPDDLSDLVSPTASTRSGLQGLAQTFVPGLYDYFTADRPPPALPPKGYVGKVQSADYDPYAIPALRDATTIAGMAVPAGRAEALAEGVAPYIARGAQAARPVLRDLMQGAGGLGGAEGAVSPAYAGERPGLTTEDTARLGQLDKDIAALTRQKQTAISQVGRSRIGATAQSYDDQIAAKQAEIDRVRSSLAQRQAEYDKAGRPLSQRDPEATSIMRYGGLGLGAMTGLAAGLKRVPAWHSALYGGIEGGLGAAAPTLIDLPMPKETEAGSTARANIHSPEWYSDVVGPDALAGAAAGLGFHGTGHVIGAPFGKRAGVSPDVILPPATGGARKWPTDASSIKMVKDSAGRWREAGTGQFIPKNLQPPSGKVIPMRAAEADGGAVRGYWGGGSPFADVPTDDMYGGVAPQGVAASAAMPDTAPVVAPPAALSPAARGIFARKGNPTAAEAKEWADANPATFAPGMQTVGPGGITSGKAPFGYGANTHSAPTDEQWATYEASGRPIPHSALPVVASYRNNGVASGGYGDLVPLSPVPGSQSTGVAPQSGIDLSSNSKLWPSLMAAGFGMMASRSPYPLQAIGEGALTGLGAYTKASELESQRAMKQSEIQLQAERLWQQNETERKKLSLESNKFDWSTKQPKVIQTPFGPRSATELPDGTFKDITTGQSYGSNSQVIEPGGGTNPQLTPAQYLTWDSPAVKSGIHAVGTNPSVLEEAARQGVDPGTIKAVAEGRQDLNSVPARQRSAIEAFLHQYDPEWDQTTFLARQREQNDLSTNGNAGKMLLAVNQLWPHLEKASKQAEALDNTNYPAVNTIKNWLATATGDQRVKQFNSVREVAAMDAARLLRGTGAMAEKDIEFWRDNLANSGSPRQMQNVLADLADDLMRARVGSIEQGYRTVMKKEPPKFISDEAKTSLGNVIAQREITNARDRLDKGDPRQDVEEGLRSQGIDPARLGPRYAPKGPVKGQTLVRRTPAAAAPTPEATTQPAPTQALPPGAPPGAKPAKDGKIYVPDPDRPGKYLEWKP